MWNLATQKLAKAAFPPVARGSAGSTVEMGSTSPCPHAKEM